MPEVMRQNPALEIVSKKTEDVRDNQANESYIITPFDDDEFREACQHIIKNCPTNTEVLPLEKLRENVRGLRDVITQIEMYHNPEMQYFLTIYPTSDLGNPLSESSIAQHHYLHRFVVDPKTHETSGFSAHRAKYIDLLPPFIRQHGQLTIPKQWATDSRQKYEQAAILIDSYLRAYNKMREFLGMEPFNKKALRLAA